MKSLDIPTAARYVLDGAVVACPTEAVYGLSCDPWNEPAVRQLLRLKHRDVRQGLILVAGGLYQLTSVFGTMTREQQETIAAHSPGHVSWLVPASRQVPEWIRGEHDTVAIRVTAHPIMAELCRVAGKPLVSTSANPSTRPPARDTETLSQYFPEVPVVEGQLGTAERPSEIRDLASGRIIRPG